MSFLCGPSMLHRLHPLVKLAWLLWGTVAVFWFKSAAFAVVVAGLAVVFLLLSGVAPWRAPAWRFCLTAGVVIFVAQIAAVQSGVPVVGPVTDEGLMAGLRASGRLVAVVLLSAVFVATTEPYALACALVGIGLPYRWGFALVTALRLAPIFQTEAHQVYRAQLVRGVAYDAVGPRRWWCILRRLCLPMLVSALRTAHSLSLSMEGRCFGLHRRRTFLRRSALTYRDAIAVALLAASVLAAW